MSKNPYGNVEGKKWLAEETACLKQLVSSFYNRRISADMAKAALAMDGFAERSGPSVRNKIHSLRKQIKKEQETEARLWPGDFAETVPARMPAASSGAQAAEQDKLQALKGIVASAEASVQTGRTPGKTLVFSDTHGHLMRVDALRAAILSNLDAECVAIVGDIFDFYDLSYFDSQVRRSLIGEWTLVAQLFQTLVNLFPKIIVVRGNHDMRLVRKIYSELGSPEIYPFMRGAFDPLVMMANGYGFTPDGELAKMYNWKGRIQYSQVGVGADGCLVRHGNTLLSHVDRYLAGGPGRTAHAVSQKVMSGWGMPHDCLIQAHTHALSKGVVGNRLLLIESGCMSDEAEYVRNKALKYRPQSLGWVELQHNADGTIDIGNTRVRYYGSAKKVDVS